MSRQPARPIPYDASTLVRNYGDRPRNASNARNMCIMSRIASSACITKFMQPLPFVLGSTGLAGSRVIVISTSRVRLHQALIIALLHEDALHRCDLQSIGGD